ncbi:MAG TPA: hypothetical protein VLH18_04060 [Candidatus Limnocylindrales bacterium]|nr:hypothetical protein [Candidatus Limnocylindrales bacterium]
MSIQGLTLNPAIERGITVFSVILLTFFGVSFFLATIYSHENYWAVKEMDVSRNNAFKGMFTLLKLIVWTLPNILLLNNLGIRATALVVGLSIGGDFI